MPSAQPWPHDWLAPQWPAPAGVHAVCTTRQGGVSTAPRASLNLGSHVGDDPAAVDTNRQIFQAAMQGQSPGTRPVFLNQVHGTHAMLIDRTTPDGMAADACMALQPGVACTVLVADCLPVLLTDRSGGWVGAVHAGWRGLAGAQGHGVLESFFERLQALVPQRLAHEAMAWLGPCIGPQAFEVGLEVYGAFCDADPVARSAFIPHGKDHYLADLAGLARQRLKALGVAHIYGNDSSPGWCTVTQASRFFSHRRDTRVLGGSGRLAAAIWRG